MTMRSCLRLCGELGVNAGAHPGFVDRENFGRKEMPISFSDLVSLIESQAGGLELLADEEKVPISHIKLHGALYHVVERDRRLSAAYVEFVKERFPGMRILASPNGCVIPIAERLGLEAWAEIFSDRGYMAGGGLIPRSEPDAVLRDPSGDQNADGNVSFNRPSPIEERRHIKDFCSDGLRSRRLSRRLTHRTAVGKTLL